MKAVVPTETADAPTLVELLANKGEYASVKAQAFLELKRFSRQLRGVMLLCDDLAGLASIDEAAGKVFCLADAPNAESAIRVHKEAHGLVADRIFPVSEGD